MDVLVTLFYILFVICVVYPPTEVVAAGFTIGQLFDNYLGSENTNFIGYHMKRTTITILIHSLLPLGYIVSLWVSGLRAWWLTASGSLMAMVPLLLAFRAVTWWENNSKKHPIVKCLMPYVQPGSDWRVVAASLNVEFRSVDKVSIQLTATSKFVATESWLIKVSQYSLVIVKQQDCALIAVATDSHDLTLSGEDEIQFINIEAIPSVENVPRFAIRVSAPALRELQPRLLNQVLLPEHLSIQPTLIERFIVVFRSYVEQNPDFVVNEEPELCIGCMQARADVKLHKRCSPQPAAPATAPPCQECNCRVLWCCACLARWWATRAGPAPDSWLAAKCTCPVCRAPFCLLDIALVRMQ